MVFLGAVSELKLGRIILLISGGLTHGYNDWAVGTILAFNLQPLLATNASY